MASMKVCFAVGLFMIAWFRTGLSEDIPDDVVYTEIKKTFVNGTKGVLTCQFKGTLNAVYWIKGFDTDIALSFMAWVYGSKSGPRYEDGSCDMDENYSLIINNVRHEDAGRFICEISDHNGVLIHNYTDVTITNVPVKTEKNVLVQKGKVGVIPCQLNIRPKRVSWVRNPNSTIVTMDLFQDSSRISGPAYQQGLFNMTKVYSLVINDVTIQHEGYYFCEVNDFDTDEMYRDDTLLTVFARPTTPFPTIKGCPMEDHTNCVIITGSTTTLTCYANAYYPGINLIFMHGSRKVEYIGTQTWNNTDGTKNTSITIYADKSKDSYKCIASEIPGSDPNEEVSASVRLIGKERNSLIFLVILVPIVICLTVILLIWMRKCRRGRRLSEWMEEIYREEFVKGHISYVELWNLVEHILNKHRQHLLEDVILSLNQNERLRINESQTNTGQIQNPQDYFYKKLCEWKETDQTINQRAELRDKCFKGGLEQCFSKVEDFRKLSSTEVPSCDLEHILWQINDPLKIREFLSTLAVDMPEEMLSLRKKRFMQEAMNRLVLWSKGHFPFSAIVIISFVLEKLGHHRADDNFFQIPAQMKGNIDNQELQEFARKNSRLEKLVKKCNDSIKKGPEMMVGITLKENDEVLFNTEKMLLDWFEDVECSNYKKRLILKKTSNDILNNIKHNESIDDYPSNEELTLIAGHLNSKSMASVCNKLHITPPRPEDVDGEKQRFEVLYQWRTTMNDKACTSVYGQLRSVLQEVGILGILPPLRSDPVHKAEYVDIAYDLLMTDVLPVAKALDISVDKLPAYRPVFQPSHLKRGTIGLVARLVESLNKDESRRIMYSRLREAGFPISIAHRILVYPVGYGELYAILDAMMEDGCKQEVPGTSNDEEEPLGEKIKLLSGNGSTPKNFETFTEKRPRDELLSEGHLRHIIKNMLKLTDEELAAHALLQTEHPDKFTLVRMWKERLRLVALNERVTIIQGLIDFERHEIARSVAEGKYRTTDVSLRFINNIFTRMDAKEQQSFLDTVGLKKEAEKVAGVENVCQRINDFLKNTKDKSSFLRWKKSRWDLSDKLVDNGFLDIARELIIPK